MAPKVSFTLYFNEPQAHYVEIDMFLQQFADEYLDIVMPVWAPGSYLIREYAKNIEGLSATNGAGDILPCRKINKNTWRITHTSQDVHIHYSVYAFESSVRTSFIDVDHAFISPVGTFMYVDNHLDLPAIVEVQLPAHWQKISTGLPKTGPNHYYAANFDILFDTPFEIGNHDTWSFDVDGTLHECAMVGPGDYDQETLSDDIKKIVKEENRIWGSNPNDYYLIVTHNTNTSHGGLEHLNSTILATPRHAYSQPTSYKSYLSLVAHEYFHLWNVKRLRPKELGPFDYTQENYTTGLWIMEGLTSYYDNLIIRRCDIWTEQEYLQQLAVDFNIIYNRPGRHLQSAAAASFDTWIKQYRPDENSPNVSISYYNKGALHALALDILILTSTKAQHRLDSVLKAAYERFYLMDNRGFEEHELQLLAQEVTGVDVSNIFIAAHQTEELDYNSYLNLVGYQLINLNEQSEALSLGIRYSNVEGKLIIKGIDRDTAAWVAGLNVEDELIAINELRVDSSGKTIDYFLSQSKEHEELRCLICRSGLLRTIPVILRKSDKKYYSIERNPDATEDERYLGNVWLSI